MNLLLLDPDEIDADGFAELGGRRAEHLRRVLEVAPGKMLRGGIVRGPRADVRVVAVGEATVRLAVSPREEPPAPPALDLVVALPRPQVLHRVLQFSAAMGVRHLDLTASWRVEKSFFGSPSLRPETIARHLRLGAEQGMTTWVPSVAVHQRFVTLLEELSGRSGGLRLLAHPEAPTIERAWPPSGRPGSLAATDRVVLAIGPEGGWIDREVTSFTGLGFVPVGLGSFVLRVEAAVVAALAQIELLRRCPAVTGRAC